MSDAIESKAFIVEVSARIEIETTEFPDKEANEFVDKIKTKIFCNRETMTLLGLKSEVYEVIDDEEN